MTLPKKSPAARPPTDLDLKARMERLAETLPEQVPEKTPEAPILDSRGKPYTQGKPLPKPFAVTSCAADVEPEDVSWLWDGRILATRVTIFYGMPDQGKSTLVYWVASVVTTGGGWPDCGSTSERGTVLIAQAEEHKGEDLSPRLIRFGADLGKVHYLDGVREGDRVRRFSLGRDCFPGGPLEGELDRHGDVRAVILDPFGAFLSGVNTRSTEETYDALTPLRELAERRRFAAVIVAHPNKSGEQNIIHRLGNSQAFGALARAMWYVSADPNDPTRRMLSYAKGNPKGLNRKPLAWAEDADGALVFDPDAGDLSAQHVAFLLERNLKQEAIRAARRGRKPGASAEAPPLILAALAGGPKLRATLAKEVVSETISGSSFNRALDVLEAEGKVFCRPVPPSKKCFLVGLVGHYQEGPPALPFGTDEPNTPGEFWRDPVSAVNGYAH